MNGENMGNNIQKELIFQRFLQREYGLVHPTYDSELAFYALVKAGNVEELENIKAADGLSDVNISERGILSEDRIRNLKYHIIVTIAMISRFCIEGGLDEKVSYGLSDIYINRIDQANSEKRLHEIHTELILDYAQRMKKVNSMKRLSIHCIRAMDYISDHLHEPITVQEVADNVGLDRTYLGKMFKRETGQCVAEYIRCRKVETAQNMLVYSEFSCADISQYLGFASHSHFSDVFRKYTGMTPSEYKVKYYRKHWEETCNHPISRL